MIFYIPHSYYIHKLEFLFKEELYFPHLFICSIYFCQYELICNCYAMSYNETATYSFCSLNCSSFGHCQLLLIVSVVFQCAPILFHILNFWPHTMFEFILCFCFVFFFPHHSPGLKPLLQGILRR